MMLEDENDDNERDQDIISATNTTCNKREEDSISNHFPLPFSELGLWSRI
jgi:hypothetical protein